MRESCVREGKPEFQDVAPLQAQRVCCASTVHGHFNIKPLRELIVEKMVNRQTVVQIGMWVGRAGDSVDLDPVFYSQDSPDE